jgi:hypothetical protein
MEKNYKRESDGTITVTIKFKPEGSFLEQEEQIAKVLSETGMMMAEVSLKDFDTNGDPIIVENKKMTSRGQEKKSTKRSGGR